MIFSFLRFGFKKFCKVKEYFRKASISSDCIPKNYKFFYSKSNSASSLYSYKTIDYCILFEFWILHDFKNINLIILNLIILINC